MTATESAFRHTSPSASTSSGSFQEVSGQLTLSGFFFVLCGERILGYGDWRWPVTGLGAFLCVASTLLRVRMSSASEGGRRKAHRVALVTSCLALSVAVAANWSANDPGTRVPCPLPIHSEFLKFPQNVPKSWSC